MRGTYDLLVRAGTGAAAAAEEEVALGPGEGLRELGDLDVRWPLA